VNHLVKQQRRLKNERQPLLPLNSLAREVNRRNEQRERQDPQQMDLLAPPQLDLFAESATPR